LNDNRDKSFLFRIFEQLLLMQGRNNMIEKIAARVKQVIQIFCVFQTKPDFKQKLF